MLKLLDRMNIFLYGKAGAWHLPTPGGWGIKRLGKILRTKVAIFDKMEVGG